MARRAMRWCRWAPTPTRRDHGFTCTSSLYLVRQFSDELAHDLPERDEQLAQLVCDIVFPAASPRVLRLHELWSQDHRSHAAFIDAVESDPAFQHLMNAEPISSRDYWEEA